MARLVGVSVGAIRSYEQGWRKVPVHVERQAFFLCACKFADRANPLPCWEVKHCDPALRGDCPAWEFDGGFMCWFINGTVCEGKVQTDWSKKMERCRKCDVFRSVVPLWPAVAR